MWRASILITPHTDGTAAHETTVAEIEPQARQCSPKSRSCRSIGKIDERKKKAERRAESRNLAGPSDTESADYIMHLDLVLLSLTGTRTGHLQKEMAKAKALSSIEDSSAYLELFSATSLTTWSNKSGYKPVCGSTARPHASAPKDCLGCVCVHQAGCCLKCVRPHQTPPGWLAEHSIVVVVVGAVPGG